MISILDEECVKVCFKQSKFLLVSSFVIQGTQKVNLSHLPFMCRATVSDWLVVC